MVLSPYRFSRPSVALAKSRIAQEAELYNVYREVSDAVGRICELMGSRAAAFANSYLPTSVKGKTMTFMVVYCMREHENLLEFVVRGPNGKFIRGAKQC